MTTYFLVITVVMSVIALQNETVFRKLIFNPYLVYHRKEWYRFFSSGLIHADFIHLAINMFVFYSFGRLLEFYYQVTFGLRGEILFVILYVSGFLMSLLPTYNSNKLNPAYNGLGASGSVSAVVFACIFFDPLQPITFYFAINLPGIIFGVLYLVYGYYMGKRGGDNVNHSAHNWGALYGILFTVVMKPSLIIDFFEKLIFFRNNI